MDLLDSALQHLRLPIATQQPLPRSVSPPPGNGEGSGLGVPVGTRTALIHATVMEAYVLLPAGAYPQASAARLFDWALGQLLGLLSSLAEGAEGREVVVESSLLSDFVSVCPLCRFCR